MESKKNALFNRMYKKEILNLFFNFSRTLGSVFHYVEKDDYIEFFLDNKTYAVLLNGQNWDEIKRELLIQKERKIKENTKRKELEQHDSLTKLYNKGYSKEIIEDFLKKSDPNSKHALMIVDIDDFYIVNEKLGYIFGDTVLVNIADSLNKIFYNTDIVGRIGGDEFLILLKDVPDATLLKEKAEEIYSVFRKTYTGENHDYIMSCSIGVAVYPTDGKDFNQLFANADEALYQAKNNKHLHYYLYSDLNIKNHNSVRDNFDRYQLTKTRAYGSSNFDKEITAFAFDIMSRTKDVNSAINLLLNKVRNEFDCNDVCIIEEFDSNYKVTYYCSKEGIISTNRISLCDLYNHKEVFAQNFNENGIFIIDEVNNVSDNFNREILNNYGLKSLLQCGIFEDGVFKGCVSISENEKKRNWNLDEIDSLVTITKIISSYLLKMRASERANQELYQIRNFDSLTGLPTLYKFKKDVQSILEEHPEKKYAIINSDINQFKYINDSLGYDAGDKILSELADYLSINNKILSRISGDNFLALVEYTDVKILEKLIVEINEQFNNIQKSIYPGYKFVIISGISFINKNEDISIAIDNANIARKSVKNSTKTVCKLFDISMKVKLQKEAEIINCMEQALKDGEFIVYLQPKIDLKENVLSGAEALVRWQKGDYLMPPNDFIPLFEKNGFIVNLDFYIYEEVCKILRQWIVSGFPIIPISINVSRVHLNDESFVNQIRKLADSYNIPYHLLELELTENIFINNAEVAISIMKNLRKLGFGVSIDDFGAGYSSLNLLKNMETDVIKLDKEFFGNGEMHDEEKIIVSSIISMAKQLNMKVLSEGVETQIQSDYLKSVCCDMAQGYLYSKPIPVAQFEKTYLLNKKPNDNFPLENIK